MIDNPPDGSVPASDMGGPNAAMEMCVPLSSLNQPDEQENMQAPGPGDPVTMTVEGTISRVEGDNAYVTPSAVNGNKVEAPAAPQDEESQLRGMAAGMGNQTDY